MSDTYIARIIMAALLIAGVITMAVYGAVHGPVPTLQGNAGYGIAMAVYAATAVRFLWTARADRLAAVTA